MTSASLLVWVRPDCYTGVAKRVEGVHQQRDRTTTKIRQTWAVQAWMSVAFKLLSLINCFCPMQVLHTYPNQKGDCFLHPSELKAAPPLLYWRTITHFQIPPKMHELQHQALCSFGISVDYWSSTDIFTSGINGPHICWNGSVINKIWPARIPWVAASAEILKATLNKPGNPCACLIYHQQPAVNFAIHLPRDVLFWSALHIPPTAR